MAGRNARNKSAGTALTPTLLESPSGREEMAMNNLHRGPARAEGEALGNGLYGTTNPRSSGAELSRSCGKNVGSRYSPPSGGGLLEGEETGGGHQRRGFADPRQQPHRRRHRGLLCEAPVDPADDELNDPLGRLSPRETPVKKAAQPLGEQRTRVAWSPEHRGYRRLREVRQDRRQDLLGSSHDPALGFCMRCLHGGCPDVAVHLFDNACDDVTDFGLVVVGTEVRQRALHGGAGLHTDRTRRLGGQLAHRPGFPRAEPGAARLPRTAGLTIVRFSNAW